MAQAFADATLVSSAWNHRAHVIVAMMAVRRFGEREAITWMRNGIRRLNAAHGLVETPTRGYHETLTRFWVWRVARFLDATNVDRDSVELADEVWAACGERNLPLQYWTSDLLFSPEARAGWQEPDLKALGQ